MTTSRTDTGDMRSRVPAAPAGVVVLDGNNSWVKMPANFEHGFAVAADQMARAHVAFDRHEIGKEPARPQHRIAALAFEGRHHHQRAAVRIERADEPIDQACVDLGHIAKTDDRAVGFRRNRCDAGLEGGTEPLRKIRIMHEANRQSGKRRLDVYQGKVTTDEIRLIWGMGGQILRRPRPDVPTQRF